MVALTRLDCLVGSAGLIRQATVQAIHHCRHRRAFGKALIDQPLMQNVLADLAIESEAALALGMRVARAVDASPRDPQEAAFARIATAIGKYWVCKRAVTVVNEAQECLGGAGYTEDGPMARLYRQAPLNSIWEGCGNIQCLDVLRALGKEPGTREALHVELQAAKGMHPDYDRAIASLDNQLSDTDDIEHRARLLVEQMANGLTASFLLRAQSPIAEAYCRSRLAGAHGTTLGALPRGPDFRSLIDRAFAA